METWSRTLDLRQLAERFGTPLYLDHLPTLERNFAGYLGLVEEPGNVRYPVKANPSPLVVERLAALGSGADCASRDEVRIAQSAGIPVERITYNTPAVNLDLAVKLLASGGTVVADSFDVLDELRGRLAPEAITGELFVRVNPGRLPGYRHDSEIQKYTSHGADTSQFGIPSEEVVDYLASYPLPVRGLHVHVGTQMDNVETFVQGLGFLHQLCDLLAERTAHRIATLNLGGGLGIPFLEGQDFPAVAELVAALAPLRRPGLRYQVEPGNSLVGEAVALLTRVVATKSTRGRRWGIVDVGTDQLVKFTVARWEHQIVDAAHRPLARSGPDGLSGPLCFAGDVLLPETSLDGVKKGDPLLVQHAGAYCESVASRFNGRRGLAHVAIDEAGGARLVRQAEDTFFEPMVQTFVLEEIAPEAGEAIAPEVLSALESQYMHSLANDDRYRFASARKAGARSYEFTVETGAAVDFVAMPLALRIIGDATIISVGHALGWRRKARAVWATRLSMSCGEVLPSGRPLRCRVSLSALSPQLSGDGLTGTAYYRLGDGEVSGVAKVVVPPS